MVGSRKKGRSLWKPGKMPPRPSPETHLRSLPLEAPRRLFSLGLPRKVVGTSRLALWLPKVQDHHKGNPVHPTPIKPVCPNWQEPRGIIRVWRGFKDQRGGHWP